MPGASWLLTPPKRAPGRDRSVFEPTLSLRTCLDLQSNKAVGLRSSVRNLYQPRCPIESALSLVLAHLCESAELSAMVKELDIRGWRSEFEVATGLEWAGVTETRENQSHLSHSGPVFVSTSTFIPRTEPLKLFEETAVKLGILPTNDAATVPRLKKTVVAGSMLQKDEDFLRLLRHGVEDAQVVLMLALLPNLKKLHVDGMSIYSTLDWHFFLRNSNTALRDLRELCILSHLSPSRSTLHSTTLGFLEFTPDLECLRLSCVNVKRLRINRPLMSNKKFRDFEATECQVDHQMLRYMMSGQTLTSFCYKPDFRDITEDQNVKFAEDAIVDCLKDSQQSLQRLSLYSTRPSKSPQISHFDRLKTLELPFRHGFLDCTSEPDPVNVASLLRKRIPRSLSTLTLRYVSPSSEVSDTMEILSDLKSKGLFPQLELIQLNFCRYSRNAWFPPVPYGDLGSVAAKMFGGTLEKAGLQLWTAQTD